MVKPVNSNVNQLKQLRNEVFYSVLSGNYKEYKKATKECAKYTLENLDLARATGSPRMTAPLFSRVGLNIVKIWFLNLFRIKSPEEKALKKLQKEQSIRLKADKYIKEK